MGQSEYLVANSSGILFRRGLRLSSRAPATVDVVASADAVILQIYVQGVLHGGHMLTPAEAQFTGNILGLMAEKNRLLTEKMRYLTQRSTRQKIMLYLSNLARDKGKSTFALPFNRQQMADFLSVDRSALSAELSKMKKDGLIDYHKDQFSLL